MDFKNIQTNQRRPPYLQDTKVFSYETLKRVADISIPFLNLYAPAAKCLSVGLGSCNSVMEIKTGCKALQTREWKTCLYSFSKAALLAASVAGAILMPIASILCTQGMQIAAEIASLAKAIFQRQPKQMIMSLGGILSSAVYVAAALYALPELLLLSLLTQGASELRISYREFHSGRYLETVANVCLAAIRGYGAREHALTVKRNWFGKKMSQKDWDALMQRQSEKDFDIEKSLIEGDLSSYIENIQATDQRFYGITFKNISFKNCNFSRSSFSKSVFRHVFFNTCTLEKTSFIHALLSNVTFQKCSLQASSFYQVQSDDLQFITSNLCNALFNNSLHRKLMMQKCSLEGASFLHAQVKQSTIRDSDLTNCLLANCKKQFSYKNCKEHKFTKTVIALTWNFDEEMRYTPKMEKALREEGALVMLIALSPEDVNPKALGEELLAKKHRLQKVHFSIADELVSGSSVEMDKLQQKVQAVMESAQGIVLSGGADVEKTFYNLDSMPDLAVDHRRSIFELQIIKAAKQQRMPIMAVCRGSQIVNVYHGGTLKDVGWQSGAKLLSYTSDNEKVAYFQHLLQDHQLYAYSNHHQAIDQLGQGLEILAHDGDIPKLVTESSGEGFMLLTQFHPEVYLEARESAKEISSSLQKAQEMLDQGGMEEKEQKTISAFIDYFRHFAKLENHNRFYKHFIDAVQTRKRSQLKLWA